MMLHRVVVSVSMFTWLLVYPMHTGADVRESGVSGSVERHLSEDEPRSQWVHSPELLEEDPGKP